jgi:hypothetical protein
MPTDIDDAPVHRLRLHTQPPRVRRHPVPPPAAALPPEMWLYGALVIALAAVAASRFLALAHVR